MCYKYKIKKLVSHNIPERYYLLNILVPIMLKLRLKKALVSLNLAEVRNEIINLLPEVSEEEHRLVVKREVVPLGEANQLAKNFGSYSYIIVLYIILDLIASFVH